MAKTKNAVPTVDTHYLEEVQDMVALELQKQRTKWGWQNHSPEWWMCILGEEYGEACQAAVETELQYGKQSWDDMAYELVQLAAVAVSIVDSMARNGQIKITPKEREDADSSR